MSRGVSRDEITQYLLSGEGTPSQQRLAQLRLEYSKIGALRSNFVASLRDKERLYPTVLPIQASGRWSYLHPNLSGFPKECISPECPTGEHEKTILCWSILDCLIPDKGTFWIDHDLDAVEHRIYALILYWRERLEALKKGVDIHTPVACRLFSLSLPSNLFNPHTVEEDAQWRAEVKWRGKDDSRRTIGKNFTYGGQYFYVRLTRANERTRKPYRICNGLWYNPSYVYSIPNIQSYRIEETDISSRSYGDWVVPEYEKLAIRFIEDPENLEIQKRKAARMEQCRVDKVSRTLYGGKRYGWFQNQDTAKKLFNHIIQGTVASYIDESAILLQKEFPESYLIHNKHDSLKWAFPYHSDAESERRREEEEVLQIYKKLTQRTLLVGEHNIDITATFKIIRRELELDI